MKKFTSLLLTIVMCLCAFGASAQALEGMSLLQFDAYGFQIAVPTDWIVVESSGETEKESVLLFEAQSREADHRIAIRLSEAPFTEIDALLAFLKETYTDAQSIIVNGVDMIGYADAQSDWDMSMIPYGEDGQALTIAFYPFGDTEFINETAAKILTSFAWVEE